MAGSDFVAPFNFGEREPRTIVLQNGFENCKRPPRQQMSGLPACSSLSGRLIQHVLIADYDAVLGLCSFNRNQPLADIARHVLKRSLIRFSITSATARPGVNGGPDRQLPGPAFSGDARASLPAA